MANYAKAAVEYSRNTLNVDLDYSVGSVERVEQILSDIYRKFPKGRLTRRLLQIFGRKGLQATCNMFGGYIGEVMRRQLGGTWTRDPRVANTFCLCKNGNRIFPPSKVYKRLTDGENNNVWLYAQVVMKEW